MPRSIDAWETNMMEVLGRKACGWRIQVLEGVGKKKKVQKGNDIAVGEMKVCTYPELWPVDNRLNGGNRGVWIALLELLFLAVDLSFIEYSSSGVHKPSERLLSFHSSRP